MAWDDLSGTLALLEEPVPVKVDDLFYKKDINMVINTYIELKRPI